VFVESYSIEAENGCFTELTTLFYLTPNAFIDFVSTCDSFKLLQPLRANEVAFTGFTDEVSILRRSGRDTDCMYLITALLHQIVEFQDHLVIP